MQKKIRIPFSNYSFENWQNLIILSIIVFSSIWWSFNIGGSSLLSAFGGDYLAFWSAGKVADEKGYSEVYDLKNLKSVQLQELNELGLLEKIDAFAYSPIPAPLLPVFIFPFQVLSKINFEPSYWVWTFINLMVLIGYLIFFTKKIAPGNLEKVPGKKLILLMLISYPVWINFSEGQVEVLLVVCAGEFIRQAINKKPLLSGLWLGGLLLKPQLLILIVPMLLFMRYWKAFFAFFLSSFALLVTSFLLSGFTGIKAMINMWFGFSTGMATNAPEAMINWRMIGLNLNNLFNTSIGWVITGLGMALTVGLVYTLIKERPSYGNPAWIVSMAAVISATLAVTWHSHYHMAVVLIPFLIYGSQFNLFPYKIVFAWATTTTVLFLIFLAINILILLITKTTISGLEYLVAISGFCLNLLILIPSYRHLRSRQNIPEIPELDNLTA